MSFLVLLILLCLSLRACDARDLRLTDKETGKQISHFGKDVEKKKLVETSITSMRPSSEERQSHQEQVKNDDQNSHKNLGRANMRKGSKYSLSKRPERGDGSATSGNIISSFQKDLQEGNIKGMKREMRSLLRSEQHDDTEEALDAKEKDDLDDTVVMDYAQPHRKPPIHNEKP